MSREAVIVAVDAKRSKGSVETVEWAFKFLVRPGDILLVLGVLNDDQLGQPKKHSCFPFSYLLSGGTCERSEMVDLEELDSIEIQEKYEKRKGEYKISLKTISRQCLSNAVMLQLKFAAGYCPARLSIEEARNLNTRWIVLDRKSLLLLRGHVSCNIAAMKGKDHATLMLSKATPPDIFPGSPEESYGSVSIDSPVEVPSRALSLDQLRKSCAPAPHQENPCCYPLSWRTGFPRVFSYNEVEAITGSFADDHLCKEIEGIKIYLGILQDTTVLVKSYEEVDEGFWLMLRILSRICHRNIMNFVGYCYTGAAAHLVLDFPCSGNIKYNLEIEELAQKLGWRARWSIAQEIGGSLRYLHEECADEPIIHNSVCSCSVALSHNYSAMLCNFKAAEWLAEAVTDDDDLISRCSNVEGDERLLVDVRAYGTFLLELITGKNACSFPNKGKESMIDWAMPLLENGAVRDLMDRRVPETSGDDRLVKKMAQAALRCINVDSDHKLSISEALAIVRGDELAVSIQELKVFE